MRFVPVSAALALAGLVGCTGDTEKESKDSPPPLALDDTADCNVNTPVVTGVEVSNGGFETFDNGTFVTVGLKMDVSDDDGDLDILGMYVWFDGTVDGAVDTSGDPAFDAPAYLFQDAEPCGKFTASLTLKPAVTGGTLDYSTRYDFAVVAEDHHGVRSTPYIVNGVTPNEDGTDGSAP